ncbi:MAG: hypothetical protein JSU59_08905 [Nitrospirota bacterium]|nr:MAG: hypothetical protein JSU59_08905 [Nitrospirota bacterium]
MENLNPTSSKINLIKLRVKAWEWEFEAEGEAKIVIQQFEKFQDLVKGWIATFPGKERVPVHPQQNQVLHSSEKQELALPSLERILETDPHSSILLCRIPPPGKGSEAKLVLLLLLGYLEIRGVTEVSVLSLKQAIKQSLHPVLRLDRVLHNYIRDRFVTKIGRGKGGRYRLTPLGIKKAVSIAEELNTEWNQA